jgi:SAM-dependent methyltransferase
MSLTTDAEIKRQVREFYDQVGWQEVSEGLYQNAHYEDLRPVAREYIHRCHLRVLRHIQPGGDLLLDAGSGPIQYPEYLEYSKGYQQRVCADISIVALQEARRRIGEKGLFVVADVANLPFKPGCFDGVVSLHTIHHLPLEEHELAYQELYRVLAPGHSAAVVNGWGHSPLMTLFDIPVFFIELAYNFKRRIAGGSAGQVRMGGKNRKRRKAAQPKGTFVNKHNAAWLKRVVRPQMPLEIYVWRSVTVRWLRNFAHPRWGGRSLLRFLYWLEERFPHFMGTYGNYPLIEIRKPPENGTRTSADEHG